MPVAIANGKEFDFPEGTTPEQMGIAIDEFFSNQGEENGVGAIGDTSGALSESVLGDTAAQKQEIVGLVSQYEAAKDSGDYQKAEAIRLQISKAKGSAIVGWLEAAGTVASSIIAEPVAGITGIAQSLNPFAKEGAGAQAVNDVRSAMTYSPRTQEGVESIGAVGEALNPVGEAFAATEDALGDVTFDITGSPALAALAKTLPTAALEAIGGVSAFKQASKRGAKLASKMDTPLSVSGKEVNRAIIESAPDIETLKSASNAIYKEIDNVAVKVKPQAFNGMLKTVIRKAKNANVDSVLTPKSARVVEQFIDELSNRDLRNVSDFDQIRKKAQIAAASVDPSDARVGNIMIDEIDSFMDAMDSRAFSGSDISSASSVAPKYKAARSLWGRARRAELVQQAMDKAGRQASGFENGIRTQFRSILNNKKQSRFFSKDELAAMNDVVQGSNEQNVLKLVGRLGFSEGQATNILGGLAGTAILGPATPVIGQASRWLAQRSTKQASALSDAIVKAGNNGKKITEAYLRTTPKAKRSALELSNIFLDNGADIDELLNSANKAAKEAAEVAKGRMALGAGTIAGGSVATNANEETPTNY